MDSLLEATSSPGDGAASSGEVWQSFSEDPEVAEATGVVGLHFLPTVVTGEEEEDGESGKGERRLDTRNKEANKQETNTTKLWEEIVT